MTGQHDRQDERLTGQLPNQSGHCPLTGRYFEPCEESYIARKHECMYFCDCLYHAGDLYTFDMYDSYYLACSRGHHELIKHYPLLLCEEDFKIIKNVAGINLLY